MVPGFPSPRKLESLVSLLTSTRRVAAALLLAPAALVAQKQQGSAHQGELPLKHKPQPTTAAITAPDLMTRLYIFADDSMEGREAGTQGHLRSTAYIASEVKKLGLKPMGDNGTYFQDVPMINRWFDPKSTLAVDGTVLTPMSDYVPSGFRGSPRSVTGAPVYFTGTVYGDTTGLPPAADMSGKFLVFKRPTGGFGFGGRGFAALLATAAGAGYGGDETVSEALQRGARPRPGNVTLKSTATTTTPLTVNLSRRAIEAMLGGPIETAKAGLTGKTLSGDILFAEQVAPARNVVAMLPGRDKKLAGQIVAVGAHNDHNGFRIGNAVDSDSLHAYLKARYAISALVPAGQRATAEQQAAIAAIRVNMDSIRKLHPVARLDTISNGADDDGSGSVSVLELAEAWAKGVAKPKRSILFVWHVAEEKGLLGSRYFTDNPTVTRDSIVAQLNIDMDGRGAAGDLPNGGPGYLQLVGSRRLSTELGDLVETINKKEPVPFNFDYQFDANGHPDNIYCRSDHYEYARYGIPIVFFTTGLHGDYHQVSDEPQYIDYPHMARVTKLVFDVANHVADQKDRPVVDHAKPDPQGACRQ
ncbi:MAG: peptidase [Gemmatimonadetes bacterium]|nr:peptidase [Gemmatimonadota bacterium]